MVNATTPSPRRTFRQAEMEHGHFEHRNQRYEDRSRNESRLFPVYGSRFGARDYASERYESSYGGNTRPARTSFVRSSENNVQALTPYSTSQLLNTESRARLMLSRLQDLVNQLYDLCIRANGLTERQNMASTQALQTSLAGLVTSLSLLESAIVDLEDRMVMERNRVGREVVLDRTDVFRPSANHSLLARVYGASMMPSTSVTDDHLRDRLDTFTNMMTDLNVRLDRVSRGFHDIRELQPTQGRTSVLPSLNVGTNSATVDESIRDTPRGQISEVDASFFPQSFLDAQAIPRLTHSLEWSAEELELQARMADLNAVYGPRPLDQNEGLLEMSRREIERQERELTRESETANNLSRSTMSSTNDPEHSRRLAEFSAEGSEGRQQSRNSREQTHTLENSPPHRLPALVADSHCESRINASSRKTMTSHAPLMKPHESIYVEGTEYRNCLGLWLSYTGVFAPAYAIPHTSPDM